MEYAALVDIYEHLEATASTNEKTAVLADCFDAASESQLPILATLIRGKLFPAWDSRELGVSSSLTREAIRKATGVDDDRVEEWWREYGDLGDAAALAVEHRTQQTLFSETLTVESVHETLTDLAEYIGEGSQSRRVDAVAKLLTSADPDEARYVVRTVVGAMRLGIGEGTVRDAIAVAFLDGSDEAIAVVERAHQLTNDFRVVAETARDEGVEGLRALDVELFRPLKVMLAQKAEGVGDALTEVQGDADAADETDATDIADDTETGQNAVRCEYKYDGLRTQIHKRGDEVRIFTRRLEDVTEQFPEVVSAVRERITAERCILEGETVGYSPETGRPVPFQELSQRIKRENRIEELVESVPVVTHLFDALYVDGESLLDESLRVRVGRLGDCVDTDPNDSDDSDVLRPATAVAPADESEAREFYEDALSSGHEGIMVKNLDATYQPGSRVGYMLKVKPLMEPLDLVVVGAKWSEGRKSEFLGRLHLACRVEESGELRDIGWLFSGLTDEQLAEITHRLEPLVTERDGREVRVRPEVVVEAEYEEIQQSTESESGYALRFPRFAGFRDDLSFDEVDSLSKVERLYAEQ
ncbi:DNA ligase [Haloprofundus marisrubri]|uniref:DNA ligase n=1 Tax=Haloprofundus marisrubri TaxID=1514971 RepID=A0A0W1RB29_9EURY|nr:ATP-dependent DNA ligase [Haloprofundus marisrubri]KTG10599.1 DNA ligase [Haloprofundus marisrubri]